MSTAITMKSITSTNATITIMATITTIDTLRSRRRSLRAPLNLRRRRRAVSAR
jgi:hypothetical protein